MCRLLSTLVLGLGLLVIPVEDASADGSYGAKPGSGPKYWQHRHQHRPRRHRHFRGKKITSVPELDANSAGAAFVLLVGGAIVFSERRRRAVVRVPA